MAKLCPARPSDRRVRGRAAVHYTARVFITTPSHTSHSGSGPQGRRSPPRHPVRYSLTEDAVRRCVWLCHCVIAISHRHNVTVILSELTSKPFATNNKRR